MKPTDSQPKWRRTFLNLRLEFMSQRLEFLNLRLTPALHPRELLLTRLAQLVAKFDHDVTDLRDLPLAISLPPHLRSNTGDELVHLVLTFKRETASMKQRPGRRCAAARLIPI
jgi:hypothetical protein